ncbi:MAG: metallophosphoesterase family protein [Chloroflexota bacterium]|nr:metallophosphoesterase family protein [Chloroflexota bacterium]
MVGRRERIVNSDMRIGLIADTHIPEAGKELPRQVREAFNGVDLILHAGDLIVLSVLDWLEVIAPVLAVRGNGDCGLPSDPRLRETQVLTVAGKRIGLCHYPGLPEEPSWRTLDKVMERNFNGPVDVIVFGHTHVAIVETYNGVLLVNPGSPSFPRGMVGLLGTVGILRIEDDTVEASITPLYW